MSIVGPAGVGKSRLAWEFDKYVDGLALNVLWHRGKCLSYGDGVAYWALAQIVRQRFGIGEQDPDDVVRTKLRQGLDELISRPEERDFIEPRVAQLLGAADADLARDDLFAGWRLLFERLTETPPRRHGDRRPPVGRRRRCSTSSTRSSTGRRPTPSSS